MLSALIYLQWNTLRNRLARQIQRWKQPKYLLGTIVGAGYFYLYFFRGFIHTSPGSFGAVSDEDRRLYEMLGAAVLFAFMLSAWIVPRKRTALAFTEAEVAFLFPAPITRRGLIHFKLLRSQIAILFTTIFLVVISRRVSGGNPWIHAVGWWVVISMLSLHSLGASFARTLLMDRGITNWMRRIVIVSSVAILVAITVWWIRRTIPLPNASTLNDFPALKAYVREITSSGPLPILLAPFRWVVRPYFASNGWTLFLVIWPALGLLVLNYVWVAVSDVAFEEASLETSKRLAERTAAVRSGRWRGARTPTKPLRAPFRLAPAGFPAMALYWKNLISAGRTFTPRVWISLATIAIGAAIYYRANSTESLAVASVGIFAAIFLGYMVLVGPHMVRHDFREDLMMADALKTLPLTGWQIALGEVLAPAAILSALQWCLLVVAVCCLPKQMEGMSFPQLAAITFGVALNIPFMNLLSLLIPNAAVLMFPAWFQFGKSSPQGIEATGQRLIFFLGQLLVLIVALVPSGAVAAIFGLLVGYFIATPIGIVVGSVVLAFVLGVEIALGVKLLGRLFERLDLSKEMTN